MHVIFIVTMNQIESRIHFLFFYSRVEVVFKLRAALGNGQDVVRLMNMRARLPHLTVTTRTRCVASPGKATEVGETFRRVSKRYLKQTDS